MKRTSRSRLIVTAVKRSLCLIAACSFALAASAQSFSSGSDGSDGSFDLTGMAAGTVYNFVPSNFSGSMVSLNIFNFTYITIPSGVTVRLSAKNINGPVIWLASGDVDIEGTVDLSGQAGLPPSNILDGRRRQQDAGAGGYAGGMGGNTILPTTSSQPVAMPGDGPGGGAAGNTTICVGTGGTFSGSNFLAPLVGGSGGGGGLYIGNPTPYGASGGAGGGALLLASSTTITVNGAINANGGTGGNGTSGTYCGGSIGPGYSGGGSGGGVRLVSNTLQGSGAVSAAGGATLSANAGWGNFFPQGAGGSGVIRIEAFTDNFTGTISGTQSTGTPNSAFLLLPTTPPPTVSVLSVSSVTLPTTPTASLTTPDATINTSSPVTITVQATYIPVGTVLTLYVFSDNSTQQTVQTSPLTGTLQQSTATANVTFPSGYGLSYVKAIWTATN